VNQKITQEARDRCAAHSLQEQLAKHRADLELLRKVETAIAVRRISKHYDSLIKEEEYGLDTSH
jgi:hypothetical protein